MKTNQESWEKEFEEQFRYEEYHNGWVSTGKMVSSKAVKDFIAKVREQAISDTKAQVIEIIKTLKEPMAFSFSKFDPTFTNGFEKARRKILEKVEKL